MLPTCAPRSAHFAKHVMAVVARRQPAAVCANACEWAHTCVRVYSLRPPESEQKNGALRISGGWRTQARIREANVCLRDSGRIQCSSFRGAHVCRWRVSAFVSVILDMYNTYGIGE